MNKKAKDFKPKLTSRFLEGEVPVFTAKCDLKMFNQHRLRVFLATHFIDASPPKMNPFNYLKSRKISADAKRMLEIDRDNKEMLIKINLINRTMGAIDSYNPKAYQTSSKWDAHRKDMLRLCKHNEEIYTKVVTAESVYSRQFHAAFWQTVLHVMKITSKYPLVALYKDNLDKIVRGMPSISEFTEPSPIVLKRPRCFMDFKLTNGQELGRIIIELYEEFVPVTVQNFITLCRGDDGLTFEKTPIHKITPGKFIELGDVTRGCGKGGRSIYGENFAEENYTLKHSKPGVLSMTRIGQKENNSLFSITFNAYKDLDGRQVVFGEVVRGIETLFKIEGMGRKFGKPMPPILVERCGEWQEEQKVIKNILKKPKKSKR